MAKWLRNLWYPGITFEQMYLRCKSYEYDIETDGYRLRK